MIKISKEDVKYLMNKGLLRSDKGKYPDLNITSRQKKGKRKNYYVPDYFQSKLKNKI